MARAPGHLHARLSTTRDSRSPPARQGNRANEERHFQGRAGIGVLRPGGHVTHCLTQRPVAQRLRSPARSASARRSASASAWSIVSKCSSRRPGILPVLTGPADACVPVFMGVDNLRVPRVSGAVFRHTKTAPDTRGTRMTVVKGSQGHEMPTAPDIPTSCAKIESGRVASEDGAVCVSPWLSRANAAVTGAALSRERSSAVGISTDSGCPVACSSARAIVP